MSDLLVLAGDVGGTNARLAFFAISAKGQVLREDWSRTYPSAEHAGLEEIVRQALRDSGLTPKAASFGVAGPVLDGWCRTTNLPWEIDAGLAARAAGLERAGLVNDLEACAWGLAAIPSAHLMTLQDGTDPRPGPQALIAAGTGLGEAYLAWDGIGHAIGASEGGHASFAPGDDLEEALLRRLRVVHGGHVSWERVVSGPGLVELTRFLASWGAGTLSPELARRIDELGAAAVTEAAGEGDALATAAVLRFVRLYGAEAGNLALKVLSTGGVFIAGGMAPRMRSWMARPEFLDGFLDKGRMRPVLERMRVQLVLDDRAALYGAARHAVATSLIR